MSCRWEGKVKGAICHQTWMQRRRKLCFQAHCKSTSSTHELLCSAGTMHFMPHNPSALYTYHCSAYSSWVNITVKAKNLINKDIGR